MIEKLSDWRFNLYGRRRGKKLSERQKDYILNYLPTVSLLGINNCENPKREKVNLKEIFHDDSPIWLEIGFGGGEHLLSLAKGNKNINFIGCEPYLNGVAMLLPRLASENLSNIKIFMDDARILFDVLPDASLEKIFLLFPDPWPKLRHKRRRFVSKKNVECFKKILKSNGLLYVATDVEEYARHVLEIFNSDIDFSWEVNSADDWHLPWKDWVSTRYYEKAKRAGRKITFLIFKRR